MEHNVKTVVENISSLTQKEESKLTAELSKRTTKTNFSYSQISSLKIKGYHSNQRLFTSHYILL